MTSPTATQPTAIGHHGVIGDLETLALVGERAGIEWLCWPRFDSPAVFGRLLDEDGGAWTIAPTAEIDEEHRLYHPETNVLITRFHLASGIVEIEDLMNVTSEQRAVVRTVRCVRGTVEMASEMRPRPDYGRRPVEIEIDGDRSVSCRIGPDDDDVVLATATVDLVVDTDVVGASFDISEGETQQFTIGDRIDLDGGDVVQRNTAYWKEWSGQTTYRGRWRETVQRSALVLKLLTHKRSGALIAAGTTSLPEEIGGERNWDYRYVWIRDAAFTLYAFLDLGFSQEADDFASWLGTVIETCDDRMERSEGPLAPLYDLDGNSTIDEIELTGWSGYHASSPVRVGNAASGQLQLDIYGELIDSMYLADKHGPGVSIDTWARLRLLVDWVCANWDQPDDGMWEVRSGRERFTSSALMCWVAIERGIRMATKRGRPADIDRWRQTRDEIHDTIVQRAWSEDLGAFTQTFDGDDVDASILLMPLVKFISGTDPRWLSTLEVVIDKLTHGVLVDRYDNSSSDDGLEGDDGSFGICSFWLVEALTRAGRVEEAQTMFEKMLTYSGPLGLFSEVVAPNGRQLGNYPQAFTHLSLISAALHLDEALTAMGKD